jgi:hypothetical protein
VRAASLTPEPLLHRLIKASCHRQANEITKGWLDGDTLHVGSPVHFGIRVSHHETAAIDFDVQRHTVNVPNQLVAVGPGPLVSQGGVDEIGVFGIETLNDDGAAVGGDW